MERKKSRKINKQDKKYVVKNVQKRTQKIFTFNGKSSNIKSTKEYNNCSKKKVAI